MQLHDLAHWLEEQPERELLIAPVLFAGPRDHALLAKAFALEPGWIWESDPHGGTYTASASRQLLLTHRPDHDVHFTWTASWAPTPLGRPEWEIAMTGTVPDELVAAVTAALRTLPEADPRNPGRSAATPPLPHGPDRQPEHGADTVVAVLESAGWTSALAVPPGDDRQAFRDPTGHARLVHRPHQDWPVPARGGHYAWELAAGDPHTFAPALRGDDMWQLMLTAHAPAALRLAAVRAATDPTPVRRRAGEAFDLPTHLVRAFPADWAATPGPAITTPQAPAHRTARTHPATAAPHSIRPPVPAAAPAAGQPPRRR
ncbi:hypothetical protein GCM10023205_04500 [Yinghuangia aomiensis]|uniref:DUF317 domain-containing protein n=1 Tax=Yinghuangia aomiensis TaxID=676205 RepID=A0ABP9GLU6_9ACTN